MTTESGPIERPFGDRAWRQGRRLRGLRWTITLWVVCPITVLLSAFAIFDVHGQQTTQYTELLQKGQILALTGAQTASSNLEDALASSRLTHDALFDTNYIPIPGTQPQKYHTLYDSFTDQAFRAIEDSFLQDGDVVFAILIDRNGYVPTHNTRYSVAGDPVLDRTKRMFNDPVGLTAGQNKSPFLQQIYQRDTGETLWDLSSPITVRGEHWGGFRVGFSIVSVESQVQQRTREIVGALVAVLLALTVITLLLAARISRGVGQVARAAKGLAEGDLDQRVELRSADELGDMATAFRSMIVYQRGMVELADAMADGDLTRTATPQSPRDVLGTTFERMMTNLRDLVGQVQSSAIGLADTSAQLGEAAAQTGSAVQQITMAVQNVASGAQQTSRSAQETTAAVGQLSQVTDGVARGAAGQARQVQTTSATASQMAAGIEQVAANATHVACASQQTRTAAEFGGQAVRETTAAMTEIQTVVGQAASKVRELGTLGQRIGAVVETIDDIAEQTNLLALNAAIEAARAGEHGKGFGVVADEVRKLAERSGRETKQIAELIAQVQTGTREAVAAMDSGAAKVELGSQKAAQAGQALDEILAAVQDTVRQVGEIASSSQQMASGARSVTDAMQSISAVVEESSAATEEMAAQASAVTGSIQSIAAVSEQQSAVTEQVSASTEEMSAQVEQMAAQAQELAGTAEQLKQLVARFRLADQAAPAVAGHRKSVAKTVVPLRAA